MKRLSILAALVFGLACVASTAAACPKDEKDPDDETTSAFCPGDDEQPEDETPKS